MRWTQEAPFSFLRSVTGARGSDRFAVLQFYYDGGDEIHEDGREPKKQDEAPDPQASGLGGPMLLYTVDAHNPDDSNLVFSS